MARLLEPPAAIYGFAVVKLAEALALREAGVRKPVLLMGPFDEAGLEEAVAHDIMPMVYTPIGDVLDRVAQRRGRPDPAPRLRRHGHRPGRCPARRPPPLIHDLAARRSVRLEA